MEKRLFTSESVTEGHPDKVCDAISDAILDACMAADPMSRVACETAVCTGFVLVTGEITTNAYVDMQKVVRDTVKEIGYTKSEYGFDANTCAVFVAIDEQSADIAMGVDKALEARETGASLEAGMSDEQLEAIGAGDQGMMFGYAVDETEDYMPLTLDLSHLLLRELADIRREGDTMNYYRKGKLTTYLRPDSKSQVTVEYDENHRPVRIHTIVVSTQHDDFIEPLEDTAEARAVADKKMLEQIYNDVKDVLLPRVKSKLPAAIRNLFDDNLILHVNPTGKFVLGGPHADTGLTGRKIIVDTYGGRGAHGGGAFSGKDPSKVDRSAAYACRHIAKNLVAAGVADEVLVQVAYAIGKAQPVSVFVNTYGTSKVAMTDSEIADKVTALFDMRPKAIEERLKLRNPIYRETASYGHMGRKPRTVRKEFKSRYENEKIVKEVELFTWEKLDAVDDIRKAFGIS